MAVEDVLLLAMSQGAKVSSVEVVSRDPVLPLVAEGEEGEGRRQKRGREAEGTEITGSRGSSERNYCSTGNCTASIATSNHNLLQHRL